jgi:translation initiation factor 2B subunit (eIF-2B alpha/beta/delta family)
VAELLLVLDEAVAAGESATVDVARIVCAGQPAMAALWNVCGAALAEFAHAGRYPARRREVERAPAALVRAAAFALDDALRDVDAARVLTLSYSGSVARALLQLAAGRALHVVCAESRPGGEGDALAAHLSSNGVGSEVVADALMTTYLSCAHAVIVGADAVAAEFWINKAGTYGLAAAAWFSGVPTYVIASRDKAAPAQLADRLPSPPPFERTPTHLATQLLTDIGPIPPDGLAAFVEHRSTDLPYLLAVL